MSEKFHEGEQKIQEIIGETNTANSNGRMISDKIIKGAFNFINVQQNVVVSSTDGNGNIWTSLLLGESGFVAVKDEKTVEINLPLLKSTSKDILFKNIKHNLNIGMLFIELSTRRRFRLNGQVIPTQNGFAVKVIEAYPNCPKYIQKRTITFTNIEEDNSVIQKEGNVLDTTAKTFIKDADTLFVGSAATNANMDASHRGGAKGFVDILENGTLKIPDYAGNSMYNTLGNFVINPNAGVTFIDFKQSISLQLSGEASLLFDQSSEEDLQKTTGTGRYWLFKTEKWILTERHHQADWKFLEFSPFNL
ncbi:MAG: putative pyridoxine 5'-phosphate oxidase superfamily flavin-nucleotide-binding protein [Maribacter sp.]|jgi:predicted pyridoxine 5'-phosphate oxidase superfamily flavin-nucleotide-binding protein